MTVDLEYIGVVLSVQYKWRVVDITRPRLEVKLKQRMISDNRVLNIT